MSETAIAFDAQRIREYQLRVEVGEPAAPDGLTRVQLDGAGTFLAEHVTDDRDPKARGESLRGEIDPEKARAAIERAARFPWGRAFPTRRGIPDEAIVHWSLVGPDSRGISLKVWLRDAEKDPLIASVLGLLRDALAELSQNRLYL
jgi:hypothetical protein